MPVCIICREEKEEFSDEHIIPEAIGGCCHIYNVCKNCNSIMGNKVDDKLVNHMLSKHMRFRNGLKGKTGEIPNPFVGTHHLENDSSKKYQLLPDEKSIIRPYMLPRTCEEEINKNEYRIVISVDDKDINKVDDILNKKLERLGLNINQIISKESIQDAEKELTIETHNNFDLEKYKIGLLKIAYEFAVSKIANYFNDEIAVEISHVLKNAAYDQVTRYVNIGDGFTKEILTPFAEYLDFESNKHYLILFDFNGKLYCLLSIFYMFVVGIQLSNKSYLSELDTIIGINDYAGKTFNTHSYFDIVNKLTNYSYSYVFQFDSELDNSEFIKESTKEIFPFYSNEDGFLFFDYSGENILINETSFIINYFSNNPMKHQGTYTEIPVPEKYYLKMKSNNKIIKLVKIIEKRTNAKI
jgi:hypothetical protein